MKMARFDDQERPASAAHWAIGAKLRRAAYVFAALLPLGGAIAACTPEKEPVVEMDTEAKLQVLAPEGAVIPAGLEKIKLGMTQVEVMRILAPLYDISHAADATADSPIIDQFTYTLNGQTLYGGVSYLDRFVIRIRYGYRETYFVY
jgi:hypothetical protein